MGSQIIGLPREHMGLVWPWMEASFIEITERSPTAPGCPAFYSQMTTPLCLLLPLLNSSRPLSSWALLSVVPLQSVNSNLDAGNGKQSQKRCLSQGCLMLTY